MCPYPNILLPKSHENPSKYGDTVINYVCLDLIFSLVCVKICAVLRVLSVSAFAKTISNLKYKCSPTHTSKDPKMLGVSPVLLVLIRFKNFDCFSSLPVFPFSLLSLIFLSLTNFLKLSFLIHSRMGDQDYDSWWRW